MPLDSPLPDWFAEMPGMPGFTTYAAFEGNDILAVAALAVNDDLASLCGTATLPADPRAGSTVGADGAAARGRQRPRGAMDRHRDRDRDRRGPEPVAAQHRRLGFTEALRAAQLALAALIPERPGGVVRPRIEGMSDFPLYALSEEHQAVREAVRSPSPRPRSRRTPRTWTRTPATPRRRPRLCWPPTSMRPTCPEEYGGAGADALATVPGDRRGGPGVRRSSLIPAVNKLGSLPVQIAGGEEVKKRSSGACRG